jgi:GMP synthase-like glutamine amidotransferase
MPPLEKDMSKRRSVRIAVIDNAIDTDVYKPVEHWAQFLSAPWEAFRAPEGQFPETVSDFTHVILTGSEASILDREPWVEAEVLLTKSAFDLGLSILGSCYGHQLLALALAGPAHIGPCPVPEIGWLPLEILSDSPLLGVPRIAYAFSHHFDEVRDLPPGFTILARSESCAVQAFGVVGKNVWGLQMHPEIDVPAANGFMRDLITTNSKSRELDIEALGAAPRDSGLIYGIVNHFIHFSA